MWTCSWCCAVARRVTYGFHVLLGAGRARDHDPVRGPVRGDAAATAEHIRAGVDDGIRVLVLWSFYSLDAAAMANELAEIRAIVDSPLVGHVAGGELTGITGLAYRDSSGELRRTGKAKQRPLDDFPGFGLKWNKFSDLEIARGCVFSCP